MTNILKKLLDNKPMGFKFTAAFVLVTLIPMLLLAYLSYRVIDERLFKEAEERLSVGITTTLMEYYEHGDQMRHGMLQAASMPEIKGAVERRDAKYLKGMMAKWKEGRPYVNIWIVTDNTGKVIARLNGDLKDDVVDVNGLVEKSIASGVSEVSTETLTGNILDSEGEEFHRETAVTVKRDNSDDEYKRPGKGIEDRAMALVVVTPVVGEGQQPLGAIITANVLNNERHVVEDVSSKLPGLFTSISMDGLRISTNITDKNGQTARGNLLPASVMSEIKQGKTAIREATILGQEFTSRFEPITDNRGRVIGSIDVDLPKSHLWAIQKETLTVIAAITIFGLVISLIISGITTRVIISPLKRLREKADAFARGDKDARVDVDVELSRDTKDELKILACAFNSMMNDVKKRHLEKELHLKELDEKNAKLLHLNENLKATNEELEVSYEEVQSQTEELSAANEELKILNEDMENKNAQLREANNNIVEEKKEHELLMEKLTHVEKLSSLGKLVSGVAHELNNPLTAIMGLSDLLLNKELPGQAKDQVKLIYDASHRSKRIIDNMLTFARSYKPEKRYSDLNSVISGTVALREYQLRVDNIDLELKLDPSLPKTMIDEHQLQQVFLNLINNAQHAIVEKGGKGKISISTALEGSTILTRVSDTGAGIPDDIVKKIFDPFFTTKDVGSGTGLGLSISYGIIKEHGGDISVSSRAGEGTTFVIELPVIKGMEGPEATSHAEASSIPRLHVNGMRALVLDDESVILSLLREVLSDAGFQPWMACTAEQALDILDENPPDLIISDIKMRGMNGKEFYYKVKELRPEAADKIIFMSGDSVSPETQDFLTETGSIFIKKPFKIEELLAAISRHIA